MPRRNRPLSDISEAILKDFNRAPIKRRGEYSDRANKVLKWNINYYDMRSMNPLMSRGFIAWFSRCGCLGPCACDCNGWHITAAGVEYLARRSQVAAA